MDKLVHHKEKSSLKGINLHAFIYFVSIRNLTDRAITLLGRKWILTNSDGTTTVVEALSRPKWMVGTRKKRPGR